MWTWLRRVDSRISSSLKSFGPGGVFYLIAVLAVGAFVENVFAFALVIVWLLASHTAPSEIGLRRPGNLAVTLFGGILAGVGMKLSLSAVVMPLLGVPLHNPMLASVHGNSHAFWVWTLRVAVFGGLVEEVIYRGYLLNLLTAAWGRVLSLRCR